MIHTILLIKTPTGSCQSIVTICLKNWANMKPPISLTDPTIKTEKSSQKSHTTDYVDSNEESDRKKALQDGPGFQPRPSFLLFRHCSYRFTCPRGIVHSVGKVHFNAGIEPELFRAAPRGFIFYPCVSRQKITFCH